MAELFHVLKMTLPKIFSILNNVSIRRNICLNFRMFTREEQTSLLAKVNSRCFVIFPAAMLVHTKLYKFVWNIMSNNSSTEYRTDLRLGQSPFYVSSTACNFLDFIH